MIESIWSRRSLVPVRTLTFAAVALALFLHAGTAHSAKVELKSGESFEGEIVEENEEQIVLQHPVLGRLVIPRGEVKPPEEPKVEPGLFGTPILRGWQRVVGLGFSGSTGDSEQAAFNTTLRLEEETDSFRGLFRAAYFYGTNQGETETNYLLSDYQHDFLFGGSRLFVFAKALYNYDQFQQWEHRVGGNAGIGYSFIKNDTLDFRGEIGAGVVHEFGEIDETKPEGVFGLILVWNVAEGQKFNARSTYYPNWNELPEFRLLSTASYEISLAFIQGLSFSIGLSSEYNDAVDESEGFNKHNLRYLGNLNYEF